MMMTEVKISINFTSIRKNNDVRYSLILYRRFNTYSTSKIVMYVFNEARTDEFIHNSLDFYR